MEQSGLNKTPQKIPPQIITSTQDIVARSEYARVTLIAGGTGGSGGGSALTSGGVTNQAGGAAGGSGEWRQSILQFTPGDTITITIGNGGAGGAGGAVNGNSGSYGGDGESSTIAVDGIVGPITWNKLIGYF